MTHHALSTFGHVIQQHTALFFLFGFLTPIAAAYWMFVVTPYRRGQRSQLLTPGQIARPAVPGVLERYAAWEWANESRLTPFGRWVYAELERQERSLAELAGQANMELPALIAMLHEDEGSGISPATLRALADVLGADEGQKGRLLRTEFGGAVQERRRP